MFRITTLHPTVPPNEVKLPEILATEESLANASSKSGMPKFKAQETVTRPTTPPSDLAIILPTPVPNQSSHLAVITAACSGHIDIIPKQIEPNIFIGEGKAQSGEKFFLRMEQVTNDNYAFWRRYLNATKSIVGGSRSLLEGLMQTTNAERDGNGNIQYINQHYEDCANYLDFDRAEFQKLINSLGAGGYLAGPEHSRKRSALLEVYGGSSNFFLIRDNQHYVVFASKTRDFSTHFPDERKNAEPPDEFITLKEYIRRYDDLLMCVGSWFTSDDHYHNRGIFRNPMSMIQNSHKGIAMLLHSFSGSVVQKFFPERKTMVVKPLTSMQHLICKHFKPGEYSLRGRSVEQVIEQSSSAFFNGDGFELDFNDIQVEALARYYTEHASS